MRISPWHRGQVRGFTSQTLRIISAQPLRGILGYSDSMRMSFCSPPSLFAHLPPVAIGIKADIMAGHLSLVWDMGGHPGDELQVVHPLRLSGFFAIPIADLACPFIEREPLQGEQRPDHVFSDPLGLSFCPGPDAAVDVKSGVSPGEEAVCPLGAQQLLVDEKPNNLAGEECRQPGVVDPGDLAEDAGLVHSALGHQEMQVGMKIYPGPECLDGPPYQKYESG
jgi:hypothetical protein